MCGRVAFTELRWRQLAALMRAGILPEHEALFRPRYNLAPTQQHWIVRQEGRQRLIQPAVWGFPGPKGLLINARAETVHRLPTFRQAFTSGRCVVPADGFYEWQGKKRGQRQPFWFYPREGVLLMAGLYRQEPSGLFFVILTTAANKAMRPVHDRMPALLPPEEAQAWLDAPDRSLLRPASNDWLERRRVTFRVNSTAFDDPECLAPATEPAGPAQLKLGLVS